MLDKKLLKKISLWLWYISLYYLVIIEWYLSLKVYLLMRDIKI